MLNSRYKALLVPIRLPQYRKNKLTRDFPGLFRSIF